MCSNQVLDRDAVLAVVDRYRAAVTELVNLRLDALGAADLFAVLEATETGRCQTPVIEHRAINRIAAQATPEQIGRSLKTTLATRLTPLHHGGGGRRPRSISRWICSSVIGLIPTNTPRPWKTRPIPQPSAGHTGQKYPPEL